MPLPDPDHPAWKLAQGIVAVIGIVILAIHGHHGLTPDGSDGLGAVGLGLGGKLVYQLVQSFRSE